MTRRKFLLSSAAVGLPTLGYAGLLEPKMLTIKEITLGIQNLPTGFEGFKIAQLTDFHYRPDLEQDLIKEAVAKAMDWEPDLIALTGDFVDRKPDALHDLVPELAPLRAPFGVYGVLGNHDYYQSSELYNREAFRKIQTQLLVNDIAYPQQGEQMVEVIGLDSIYSSTPNFHLPVGSQPEERLRLVLSHEPDTFDQVTARYAPHLQLSGHTHGGQCRIPFVGYAPFTPPYGRQYIDGAYENGSSSLYVSSGLGTSLARLRFACRPEIVLLTLTSA